MLEFWKHFRAEIHKGIREARNTLKKNLCTKNIVLFALFLTLVIEFYWGTSAIQEGRTSLNSSNLLPTDNCISLGFDDYGDTVYIGTIKGVSEYRAFYDSYCEILNQSHAVLPIVYDITVHRGFGGFFALTHSDWGGLYWCFDSLDGLDEIPRLVNVTGSGPEPNRLFENVASSDTEPLLVLGGGGETLYIHDLSTHNTSISSPNDMLGGVRELLCIGTQVLIGTSTGFATYNLTTDTLYEHRIYASEEPVSVNCIEYDDAKHELYLGTSHGVYIYSLGPNSLNFTARINEADGILSSEIRCLELDVTTDRLYIGTNFGVSVYDLRLRRLRKNYHSLFTTRFQNVNDLLLVRTGRARKLFVASGWGGLAILDVNNMPDLPEYVTTFYQLIVPFIGFATACLGIYVSGEKTLTPRVLIFYFLILGVVTCSMWLNYLLGIQAIPNVVPPTQ